MNIAPPLGLALLLLPGLAAAYPIPRSGAEVAVGWKSPVLELGTWERDGLNLRHVPGEHRRSFIISSTPTRGFVRLRLHGAGSADVAAAIMFRTRVVAASPLELEGYGLAVSTNKRTLAFYRWDRGGRQNPGASVELPSLADHEELEVLLWIAGPNFSATVVDGFSKDPIGSLSWSDPSYPQGQLGLFAYERTGPGVGLELWTQTEIARTGGTPTEIAKRWLVILSPDQVLDIPHALLPLYRRGDMPSADGVVLITDERGLYLLREHGIEPERIQPGLPFAVGRAPNASGVPHRELLDPAGVEAALRTLHQRFPRRTRMFEVGRSAEGRPILGLRVANDPEDRARPAILLTAAIHANEASTPSYVLDAARHLLENRREQPLRKWLNTMALVVVPMVNPDGSHAFWHLDATVGRKNRREVVPDLRNPGVDLNRNYPFEWGGPATRHNSDDPSSNFFHGPAPGSEPEVQALMALAWQERFVAMISFHSAATRLIVPYTIAGVQNPEPSNPWLMAEEMIALLPHGFGRRRYQAVGGLYPVRGVEKDWFLHTFGTMAFLVEVPFRRPRAKRLEEGITHTRPAWLYLFERWQRGPSLAVRAVGRTSHEPLEAVVSLEEIELRAGERWTTSARTGWFHHYLPAEGTYTILLDRSGQRVTRRVEVGSGVTRVVVAFDELRVAEDLSGSDEAGQMAQ